MKILFSLQLKRVNRNMKLNVLVEKGLYNQDNFKTDLIGQTFKTDLIGRNQNRSDWSKPT